MWFLAGLTAGALLGSIGTLLLVLRWAVPRLERAYVFRPSRDVLRTPEDLNLPYDQCFIDTPDGCRLAAWHVRPPNPIGSVVYFHGSTGNLGILVPILAQLYRGNLQVLAFDYRGYGLSTGTPTEEGVYLDAEAAARFFQANFRESGIPVVYWGRSLGGCFAAAAAARVPPDGLILETTFPSKASLVSEFPQYRWFRWFAPCKLDTLSFLKDHPYPILVIHGEKDRTVPLRQGQILYQLLDPPKEFFWVPGAGHIDIHMVDSERYVQRVLQFVTSLKPPRVH